MKGRTKKASRRKGYRGGGKVIRHWKISGKGRQIEGGVRGGGGVKRGRTDLKYGGGRRGVWIKARMCDAGVITVTSLKRCARRISRRRATSKMGKIGQA